MDFTLYRLLDSTKTMQASLPRLKEAFIKFYGEEYRNYIEDRLDNLAIIGYGMPAEFNNLLINIKSNITDKLINSIFSSLKIEDKDNSLRNILFTSNFDYLNIMPINCYIDYKEKKENYNIDSVVNLLSKINPNVNKDNIDNLINSGAFELIDKIIPLYIDALDKYKKSVEELAPFIEEQSRDQKTKRDLSITYYLKLLDEFLYIIPEKELNFLKEYLDVYHMIPYSNINNIKCYFGEYLISTPLIAAFSKKSEEMLVNGSDWKKESIIHDRIKFFNLNGINLGSDYSKYENSEECKKLIPPVDLIEKILLRKEELNNEVINLYYKSTNEYKNNMAKLEKEDLLIKDYSYDASSYENHTAYMSPNIKSGKEYPTVFINIKSLKEYLDCTVIHELNHAIELHLSDIDSKRATFYCGWDILITDLDSKPEEIVELNKKEEKRNYELFNEIINELIAQEVTAIMHSSNDYIFNTEENAKIKGSTSYENTFFLVRDFFKTYKKDIIESRITGDMELIFDAVGKENFEELNSLFSIFEKNFSEYQYYLLIEDLKNDRDTERTRIFKDLCYRRDAILGRMAEHKTLNSKKIN